MKLLGSNLPPLRIIGLDTFPDVFYTQLSIHKELNIAVGYITAESLAELRTAVENYDVHKLNIAIGMHYIEKFTKLEYITACRLNDFLKEHDIGAVKVVRPFKYHGKMYLYSHDDTPISAIVGSDNLNSIIDSKKRIYESSLYIDDYSTLNTIKDFIEKLYQKASADIDEVEIKEFKRDNPLLENLEGVSSINENDLASFKNLATDVSFHIKITPYETAPKSNINACYGKGRENSNTGIIIPRPWYEVELIVPVNITSHRDYPKANTESAIFDVITDDRWAFKCKVSGTNNKNLRSEGDLEILGKWLKGRLVQEGALNVGEPVTEEVLRKYGRDDFTLTKLRNGKWFLDFGV